MALNDFSSTSAMTTPPAKALDRSASKRARSSDSSRSGTATPHPKALKTQDGERGPDNPTEISVPAFLRLSAIGKLPQRSCIGNANLHVPSLYWPTTNAMQRSEQNLGNSNTSSFFAFLKVVVIQLRNGCSKSQGNPPHAIGTQIFNRGTGPESIWKLPTEIPTISTHLLSP